MITTLTVVTDVFISKAEALDTLAKLLQVPVDAANPADSRLVLDHGVVLSIEVPKFGEDLPLTVDLTGEDDRVTTVTENLMRRMADELNWTGEVVGS